MTRSLPSILEQIVADTKGIISQRTSEIPISRLEASAYFNRPPFSLKKALVEKDFAIIAEAKKASPSKGIIRAQFDPVSITQSYQNAGAAAVSILTEPLHFQGDISYLDACRGGLTIPILRKDFIVDPYQVIEARAHGADAVLLIAAILSRSQLSELQAAADENNLSTLVEAYHESELERIEFDKSPVIGVNSRDLHTFEVDLNRAIRMLNAIPQECVRVAESGIGSTTDLNLLKENNIHAALIGESFMRSEDPGEALKTFISSLA